MFQNGQPNSQQKFFVDLDRRAGFPFLLAGIVDRGNPQSHPGSIHCSSNRKLCVPAVCVELPRLSNKMLGGTHGILEDMSTAAVKRNLAVMIEQLNPEKEIAGGKIMWRLVQPDFI